MQKNDSKNNKISRYVAAKRWLHFNNDNSGEFCQFTAKLERGT